MDQQFQACVATPVGREYWTPGTFRLGRILIYTVRGIVSRYILGKECRSIPWPTAASTPTLTSLSLTAFTNVVPSGAAPDRIIFRLRRSYFVVAIFGEKIWKLKSVMRLEIFDNADQVER